MEDIFQITIILFFSMLATLLSKKLKIPEVVGQMLIGIILAPSVLGLINGGHTIEVMSEIGVILLKKSETLNSGCSIRRYYSNNYLWNSCFLFGKIYLY